MDEQPPLFEWIPLTQEVVRLACQVCRQEIESTEEGARINGWTVARGALISGKPYRVIVCPQHSGHPLREGHAGTG